MLITGERSVIKKTMAVVENAKSLLDWALIMHEGYMEIPSKELSEKEIEEMRKNYEHGSLEERYLNGDKTINWVFVLQAFYKEKGKFNKRMRVYNIQRESLNFSLSQDTDNFTGYLTLEM